MDHSRTNKSPGVVRYEIEILIRLKSMGLTQMFSYSASLNHRFKTFSTNSFIACIDKAQSAWLLYLTRSGGQSLSSTRHTDENFSWLGMLANCQDWLGLMSDLGSKLSKSFYAECPRTGFVLARLDLFRVEGMIIETFISVVMSFPSGVCFLFHFLS